MRDESEVEHSSYGLENHGLSNLNEVYWNLNTAALYEHAIRHWKMCQWIAKLAELT